MNTASQTRAMAQRIGRLHHDILASFQCGDASQRMQKLQQIGNEVFVGMLPVISWLERRKHPETAELVKRRMDHILRGAVQCAGHDIPEYAGGAIAQVPGGPTLGAQQTATLGATAKEFATSLLGWADDIEAEEGANAGGAKGEQGKEAAADRKGAAVDAPPLDDDTAYRPAKDCLVPPYDTFKQINTALQKNLWIRRRKPRRNRLEIHAGDWLKMLSQAGKSDPLDMPAQTIDAVLASERAKDEIRQKKSEK